MMPVWDGNPIEISVVSNKPGPGRNGLHSVTVIFVIEKSLIITKLLLKPLAQVCLPLLTSPKDMADGGAAVGDRDSHTPSALGARVLAAVTSRQRLTRRHPPRHPADEESEKWTVLIRLGRSWHMMGFKRDVPKRWHSRFLYTFPKYFSSL